MNKLLITCIKEILHTSPHLLAGALLPVTFIHTFSVYPLLSIPLLTLSPRGVLQISSEGDDQRIFLGLKFFIPGFFWVGEFCIIFVCGSI